MMSNQTSDNNKQIVKIILTLNSNVVVYEDEYSKDVEKTENIMSEEQYNELLKAYTKEALASMIKADITLIDAAFLNKIQDDIEKLYSTSNLCVWQNREYLFFKSKFRTFLNIRQLNYPIDSVKPYCLFQSALSKRYEELVYRHRNRCAHNTLSYQVNKPDFSVLASTDFSYHSYFFRFALIVLIDEIFMVLFRKYVSLQN